MSIAAVAEVLCRTIEDEDFAKRVGTDPSALEGLELTEEELGAFQGARAEDAALAGVPVGAFRMVARSLGSLEPALRQRLNTALAARGGTGPSIPCTGSHQY